MLFKVLKIIGNASNTNRIMQYKQHCFPDCISIACVDFFSIYCTCCMFGDTHTLLGLLLWCCLVANSMKKSWDNNFKLGQQSKKAVISVLHSVNELDFTITIVIISKAIASHSTLAAQNQHGN